MYGYSSKLNVSLGSLVVINNIKSYGLNMGGLDLAYVAVTLIMSLLSILGCLVLLVVHWVFTDLRTVGRTMLVHLTVADLLTALGNLMGVTWYLNVETMRYKMFYCKFHSALTIMSSIASFVWTVVIAWFVFWIILRRQPLSEQRHQSCYNKVLPFVCWGVPVLVAVVALSKNVLGYDVNLSQASWCWIDPRVDHPLLWMLVTGKAWELAACAGTMSLYTTVKVMLSRQAKKQKITQNHHNRHIEEANTKLTFVPLVFITIRIWGTIRFLLGLFAHDYASSSSADWIVIMQGAGDSAQGFFNCAIYCIFTSKIRQRLLQNCHRRVFTQARSSAVENGSTSRISQKHAKTSRIRSANKVICNRVMPILADTTGHQQELKNSPQLKSHKTRLISNQHQAEELFNLPTRTQQNLPAREQLKQLEEAIVKNTSLDNSIETKKTLIVLQNETDTATTVASYTKRMVPTLDDSDKACKGFTSPEEKHFSLWTTDVSSQARGFLGIDHDTETSRSI